MLVCEVAASQLTLRMVPDYPPGPTVLTGVPECGGGRVGGQATEPEPSLEWSLLAGKTEGGQEPRKWAPVEAGKGKKTDGPPKPPGVAPTDTGISARRDPSVSDLQALRESVLY